jgi:molecular chaperone GrpE
MIFKGRRMKEETDKPENKEEIQLDSVPFPDGKADDCHCKDGKKEGGGEGCKCKDHGGECDCKKNKGDASQCECGAKSEKQDTPDLMSKLDEIARENIVMRDLLSRTCADFDNYRKRTVREKEETRKSANADFALALIPVLDALALALEAARKHHPEASSVLDGIDMISLRFKSALKSQGVEEILPQIGADFNTSAHESISHLASDTVAEGKICAIARTGYSINGKLLRPASVIISSGKSA